MTKQTDGRHRPGKRSPGRPRIKDERHQEVIVIGRHKGSGQRSDNFASLLLAVNDGGTLRYVGRVGSGFSNHELQDVAARLESTGRYTMAADRFPAAERRDVVWTTPKLVGEVQFTEVTRDGQLGHPTWRGWRPDKSAECVQCQAWATPESHAPIDPQA